MIIFPHFSQHYFGFVLHFHVFVLQFLPQQCTLCFLRSCVYACPCAEETETISCCRGRCHSGFGVESRQCQGTTGLEPRGMLRQLTSLNGACSQKLLNMYEVVKSVSCRFLPAQHAGQAYRARGKARRFLGEYALSAQDFSQVPLPHGPVLVNALSGQACHFTSRYNYTVFHFMCSYIIFLQISCKLSMSILEAVHKREPNKNDVSKTNIKKPSMSLPVSGLHD